MKALQLSRPYGWRAKIGLITPSSNNINEPEFYRLAPRGVKIHTSRGLLTGENNEESFYRMARDFGRAAGELATAEGDIIAFRCTAGSGCCPLDQRTQSNAEKTGTPA